MSDPKSMVKVRITMTVTHEFEVPRSTYAQPDDVFIINSEREALKEDPYLFFDQSETKDIQVEIIP